MISGSKDYPLPGTPRPQLSISTVGIGHGSGNGPAHAPVPRPRKRSRLAADSYAQAFQARCRQLVARSIRSATDGSSGPQKRITFAPRDTARLVGRAVPSITIHHQA